MNGAYDGHSEDASTYARLSREIVRKFLNLTFAFLWRLYYEHDF